MEDLPVVEMVMVSTPISCKPRKLKHPWTFKISPWMLGGGFGETWITDTRPGGKTRVIDDLLDRIHRRERFNVRLGLRRRFQDLCVRHCHSRIGRKVTWKSIKYLLRMWWKYPNRL